ncbi:MAG: hypothetical protein V3W19_12185, partial [Desulfatiglandales bacterium]
YTGGAFYEYKPEWMVDDLSLDAGLDEMAYGEITYSLKHWDTNLSPAGINFDLQHTILPNHPHSYNMPEVLNETDSAGTLYLRAFITGVGTYLNANQDDLIANGLQMSMTNFDPGAPDVNGELVYYYPSMLQLKIFFFNPIVNSISRLWAPTTGGVAVVLTGLGFNNSDSEIETGGPAQAGGWNDEVDEIDFVGLQGQGTTTLTRGAGDFTLDSNTQITIPANKFPALSAGTYEINLKKVGVNLDEATTITGYAGDWACDSDGRVFSSTRITFFIDNAYVDRPFRTRQAPILLTDWHLKDRSDGSEIMKYWSMDTVRCTDRIYTGLLSAISGIPRGFDDKTGLLKVTDITLDLANNTLEFSKLLDTQIILKNQIVKLYQAYPDEPFGWREHIISVIIDDYFFEDDIFKVKLKDITQKYFRLNVPREICTADHQISATNDYSNIHPDSLTAYVPEVLGLCSLTTGEFRGEIEAICIDTVNYKYVAANGALYSIDQVYSDDVVAVDPSDYTISYEEDGRTYITFDADQGDNKVTFNGKGYIYGGLNSANGYVQNPAYILLYFFLKILKIPPAMIDFASFIAAATVFSNMGEDEAGKLILQDKKKPMDVAQDLMAGAKCYPRKDGRLAAGLKDISNYQTNDGQTAPVIIRQLDVIGKFERQYNMRDAITLITSEFDWVPTWKIFKSNEKQTSDITIDPWEPVEVDDDQKSPTVGKDGDRKERPWVRI